MNDFESRSREIERRKERRRKRAVIKNWTILIETLVIIALVIALIVVSVNYNTLLNKKDTSSNPSLPENGSDLPAISNSDISSYTVSSDNNSSLTSSSGSNVSSLTVSKDTSSKTDTTKSELEQWYLKLANPDNSVDNDFIRNVDVAKIDSRFSSGAESSKYFDSRAVDKLNAMCKAALDDNVKLTVVSSYRTYSYQQSLYNNRVRRCINEGYGEEEAKKVAATIVAKPGTSEHHLGLAVDINSVEESFENTKAFRWLQENAENYGFIMRYPKDKKAITKIIYEPWHYRYVGVEHAKAMNDLGYCLEEYLEYLSKKAN